MFEMPYETQASLDALHVVSHLFQNEIDRLDYNGLLSMLGGLLKNGERSYGATKRGVMEIDIQRPM
jgi:hypothetical protein